MNNLRAGQFYLHKESAIKFLGGDNYISLFSAYIRSQFGGTWTYAGIKELPTILTKNLKPILPPA